MLGFFGGITSLVVKSNVFENGMAADEEDTTRNQTLMGIEISRSHLYV